MGEQDGENGIGFGMGIGMGVPPYPLMKTKRLEVRSGVKSLQNNGLSLRSLIPKYLALW